MGDVERLFGPDSEDEGDDKSASGSNSPSGSSSDSASSNESDNENGSGQSAPASPAGSHHSAASSRSGQGSAPASPAASSAASDSDSSSDSGSASAPASPSRSASAPASPSHSASAPASPVESAPASPAKSGSGSPASSGSGSSASSGSPARSGSESPARSGSGSPARSGSGSPARSGSGSPARSGSGSPVKSRSGSPVKSRSGSPVKSGSGSPVKSRSGSPASHSSSGSKHSGSSKRSGSRSPAKKQDDSGSDSDIPTRGGKAKIASDSEVEVRQRQRLPSDSGSDPEAVRATAEDIFGEADDISEDERDKEDEEKEEVIPETRIEVEIPRVVADLGDKLSFAKLPNFLSVETRPFDPATYEDEIDEDEVMDEEGRARLKLKVENTIRWRHRKDASTGEPMTDEFGEKIRESNAKVVKWSDGSMSLHLGTEIFDVFSMPMQDHNHLYIRQGTGLQGQAMFKNKLSFRPHSTDSYTHRKMTMSLADRSSKTVKIKVLPIAGVDPELSKTDNIKKEEERLRASVRRENQQRRTREKGHGRGRLDASFLDDGVSINAIKSSYKKRKGKTRDEDLSDSADEDYETDGEDDMKRNKLQRAKRLADSDDNSSDSDQDSDDQTVKKKSKVMSGSESD